MSEMRGNIRVGIEEIQALLALRRFAQARLKLGETLAQTPDDPDLLSLAAIIELQADDLLAAQEALTILLRSHPQHELGRRLLFTLRVEQKRYAEAEVCILEFLSEFPEDADAFSEYSWLMLLTMQVEKAEQLAQEALRLDVEHQHALFVLACVSTVRGEKEEALRSVEQMLKEDPENIQTLYTLILVLAEQSRFCEAAQRSKELVRFDPGQETFIELAVEMHTGAHPLMSPLNILQRFGWAASAVIWVVGAMGLRLASKYFSNSIVLALSLLLLLYIVYSWCAPTLVRRYLRRRGF